VKAYSFIIKSFFLLSSYSSHSSSIRYGIIPMLTLAKADDSVCFWVWAFVL
jgi:hypothetical protein